VEEKEMINGGEGIQGSKALTRMVFSDKVEKLRNLRTGKEFPGEKEFEDWLVPWEANIYEVEFAHGY